MYYKLKQWPQRHGLWLGALVMKFLIFSGVAMFGAVSGWPRFGSRMDRFERAAVPVFSSDGSFGERLFCSCQRNVRGWHCSGFGSRILKNGSHGSDFGSGLQFRFGSCARLEFGERRQETFVLSPRPLECCQIAISTRFGTPKEVHEHPHSLATLASPGGEIQAPGKWGRPRRGSSSFEPDFKQIPVKVR